MTIPTPNNSFEFSHLAQQVDQFTKSPERFELAPSMEELLRRVAIVKGWIVEKKLKPEDILTAEKWLMYVEERAELDAVTKQTIQNLRADIARANLPPEEQARRVREDFERLAKDPAGFDKLVSLYLSEQAKYAPDKRISEFQMMFDRFIFGVNLSYRIDKKRVIIYDQNDVEDTARTASINRIPNVVELLRSSRAFEAINLSGQQNPLAYINSRTQGQKIPKLNADILSDPSKKARYISDIRNSKLRPEMKAFIITYVEDPAAMELAYQEMQAPATQAAQDRERARLEANNASTASGSGVQWTKEAWDNYLRNPEKLAGDLIGGMGVWLAPATIYLILNLFGVSHDSLFMKLLAGATVVGTLKGTGVLNMTADAFKGKGPIADAGRSLKETWDTSKKEGVLKWLSDKFGDISGWTKEKITQFSAWAGFSNYYAEYTGPSGKQTLDVVDIPFDYIESHVKAGTWDAKFRGNDTLTMRSNGTDLADFRRMIEELNAKGVENYGLAKWREIRANKSLKEVISVAHNKDGVISSAGNAVSSTVALGATAVAGAASVAVEAAKTGGRKVADVAGAAADTAVGAYEWLSGTNEKEINGIKVRNMPRGLSVETSSDGNKLTLKFTPSLKEGGKDVKEYTIEDKTKDAYYTGFTLGTLSITIKVKGGVIEFMDSKVAEEDRRKMEQDAKAKLDKVDYEKKLKGAHDGRFSGSNAKAVVDQIKAFAAQAKTNKQKEIATVEEYQTLLWETVNASSQIKLGSIADYIFDRTSVTPPLGISLKDTMNQAMFKRLLIVYVLGDNTSIKKEDFLKKNDASLTLEKYIFPNK